MYPLRVKNINITHMPINGKHIKQQTAETNIATYIIQRTTSVLP